MRRTLPIVAALLAIAAATLPSQAAAGLIAAAPGAQASGSYATPVVLASAAGGLTFLNQDVQPHSVVSDTSGPNDEAWCVFFPEDACPLLWSPVTDAGGRTSVVEGLENAAPGTAYGVRCVIHPKVKGTVVVA